MFYNVFIGGRFVGFSRGREVWLLVYARWGGIGNKIVGLSAPAGSRAQVALRRVRVHELCIAALGGPQYIALTHRPLSTELCIQLVPKLHLGTRVSMKSASPTGPEGHSLRGSFAACAPGRGLVCLEASADEDDRHF